MKKISINFIYLFAISGFGQSNIVASGGVASGNDGSTLSYSLGQIDYISIESVQGTLSLGNQQAFEIFILEVLENYPKINFSLYPNPTTSSIQLSLDTSDFENFNYTLFDVNGKLVLNDKIKNSITTISLENLSASIYFLSVYNLQSKLVKSFKIIKN